MSRYIESRQQPDGSWKHYLTWLGNASSAQEIIPNILQLEAAKKYPIAFGCSLTKELDTQYHNVIDNNDTKYDKNGISNVSISLAILLLLFYLRRQLQNL